jgi:hypothetical protein
MKEDNEKLLLAEVMEWRDGDTVQTHAPVLKLLSEYKYDHYQRFGPGKRFIESLALWLQQFDVIDRKTALDFVLEKLIYGVPRYNCPRTNKNGL